MGLEKVGSDLVWNNGIPFTVTAANTGIQVVVKESNPMYQISGVNLQFQGMSKTRNQFVCCQANLDGKDWY